jgi:hypothetical protein
MSGDDLIVAVPWLVFFAGLAVIGWRLAAGRGFSRERRAGPPGEDSRAGSEAAERESAR